MMEYIPARSLKDDFPKEEKVSVKKLADLVEPQIGGALRRLQVQEDKEDEMLNRIASEREAIDTVKEAAKEETVWAAAPENDSWEPEMKKIGVILKSWIIKRDFNWRGAHAEVLEVIKEAHARGKREGREEARKENE